ncbi:MAG: cytochrome c maturation protein CcmE [Wenzhouxiangellaceae bacterium]
MTPTRKRRLAAVLLILLGVGSAGGLMLYALQDNALFFYTPSKMQEEQVLPGTRFRLGGLVLPDSVERETDSLGLRFTVTDNEQQQQVYFSGILPDLFREGQGVIAIGELGQDNVFIADQVLAKHDENYMPPEVASALKEAGHPLPDEPDI